MTTPLRLAIHKAWEAMATNVKHGLAPTYTTAAIHDHALIMKDHEDELLKLTAGSELEKQKGLKELILATQHQPDFEHINGLASELWNHFFAFSSLCVSTDGGKPSPYIRRVLDAQFSDQDRLNFVWGHTAGSIVGHGWTWLLSRGGDLEIFNTFNRQTVATQIGTTPLVAIDMCEHAYFVEHQHHKEDYARAVWHNVDWKLFEERYRRSLISDS